MASESETTMVSETTCKRKRSVLTLEKKLEIIAELRKGKSQRLALMQFGVPKSTVRDVWKDRDKIEAHVSASGILRLQRSVAS